jgi:D-xylose transport system substrate-binding protein
LANKAAEVAVAMAKGEIPEANNKTNDGKVDVPSFYLDPTLVTKENMDATVIKDGFQAKAQVYQAIVK